MRRALKWMVVAVLLCPVPALADDAADALARKVVDLAVAPGLEGRFARMVAVAVEHQPAERQQQAKAEFAVAAASAQAGLVDVFTRYYAARFTPAELGQLVAFYESPVGRKFVAVEEDKPAEVNAEIQQQIMKLATTLAMPGAR